MHHIHHTEGIIMGSKNFGEADKRYFIFTRDLGMIYASASGVRKISSKLRFIMQDFAYVKIDLVEGKDWRVTSASKTGKLEELSKRIEAYKILHNVGRLLRRLLAGIEPNEKLFSDLVAGLTILESARVEDLRHIETIMVLRILSNLGYVGEDGELEKLLRSPLEQSLIFEISKSRRRVIQEINKALRETQM
jgi:DNA repair protein RecO (recombination protein O)